MTLQQKVAYFDRSIAHDQRAIAWIYKYRSAARENRTVSLTHKESFPTYGKLLRFHKAALKWDQDLYRRYHAKYLATLPQYQLPPHYNAWLCIHSHEGSWNDSGAPYYGGLQMDYSFMSSYGGSLLRTKGTADHWTPIEQMWVAEKAYNSGRGFYPWPNTARSCGLI